MLTESIRVLCAFTAVPLAFNFGIQHTGLIHYNGPARTAIPGGNQTMPYLLTLLYGIASILGVETNCNRIGTSYKITDSSRTLI